MYNYFGLPDANRKWQYHFKGRDDIEHENKSQRDKLNLGLSDYEFDESKLEEDNEQMLIVRGAISTNIVEIEQDKDSKRSEPIIEEASVCDYYLIIGHRKKFKVYPFVKKRGKATDNVGNSVFEYDESNEKLVFTGKTGLNKKLLTEHIRLQSIIAFVAMLANIQLEDVENIRNLQNLSGSEKKESVSPFEILEMIGKIYNNNKS